MQMGYTFCTRHTKAEIHIPFACYRLGSVLHQVIIDCIHKSFSNPA
jgi:hypothetical protein